VSDPDIDAYLRATRDARRDGAVRALKGVGVFIVALAVGAAVAFAVARWDAGRKEARLASYERGDFVVIRRGESIRDTSPSFVLVAGAGAAALAIVFAAGMALVVKDKTYLRGVSRAMDRSG
jgi:hypothetical protein